MISEELLQSFIPEASDLLDDVEPSLVEYSRLEDVGERIEIVNRVFRHFHSIKGSAGFVGLHDIARLTHEAETLLDQFCKAPEKIIPQEVIAILCRTVDLLRAIFQNGGESEDGDGNDLGIESLMAEIVAMTQAVKTEGRGGMPMPFTRESAPAENADATQVVDHEAAERVSRSSSPTAVRPAPADNPPVPEKSRTAVRRRSSDSVRIISINGGDKSGGRMNAAEFSARYISEANDLLEQIEQSFLHAEQHPEASGDAVREALRCLHSFKGNSGFMGLGDLERLSHRMESEVETNVGRSLGLDAQTFDVLLQMIDVLRQGVLDFSCGGSGSIPEADAYIAMMDEFVKPGTNTSVKRSDTAVFRNPAKSGKSDTAVLSTRTAATAAAAALSAPKPEAKAAAPSVAAAPPAPPSPPPPVVPPPPAPVPAPQPAASHDTTRLVLRGDTAQQEDLRVLPKSDSIVITAATSKIAMGTAVAAAKGKKGGDTTNRKAKSSDTSQKRRAAEQLASRNDIRVDLRKLDGMLDLVGELVIAEAMVTRHPVVWNAENESLERAIHQLRRVTSSLQDMATSVRMIPLAPTFRRMTRLVYDLSIKAGKSVDLVLLGEDTEVDRTVIERISDPLVHIIRNAIDHGIEPPEERARLGKPEMGVLKIEGHHEGGEVWIVITDDGRGLDREAIVRKAIDRGLIQGDGSDIPDSQVYHLIFEPGFSTAKTVTDISGRGFGMDVVKKNIEKLSGRIDIRTRPGEGMSVIMRIPLTLAIIDGMLVSSGTTRYIIPLLSIRESLRPHDEQIISTPDGQEMVKIRDELIPIVKLDEIFDRGCGGRSLSDGILMIVEGDEGDVVALFADELLGQQETVIKGLSGWLKKSRGVSGCTILGDGEVGLILDIGAIVRLARCAV